MVTLFALFLATVVTNSHQKHIELLSNEEFQNKLTRRAGGDNSNEDNNSKHINSDESHIYIGNRDDKSYIPDIDLALPDIYRRSYTNMQRENSEDNAYFNETILPLYERLITTADYNKNLEEKNTPYFEAPIRNPNEEEKINHEKNTPDSKLTIQNLKEDQNVNQEKITPYFGTPKQNPNEVEKVNQEKNAPDFEIPTSMQSPKEGEKANQEKNSPDSEPPIHSPKEEQKVSQEKLTPDSEPLIQTPKKENKVNQEKNTAGCETHNSNEELNVSPKYNPLEPETPIRVSDYEHSDTEHITEEGPTILSTTLAENVEVLPITGTIGTNFNNKSISVIGAQAPEHESEIHEHENDSTDINTEPSAKATESYIHDSSHGTLIDESTTDSDKDTTINESADLFNALVSKVFTITTQNTAEFNTANIATEDYSAVTENSSANENLETFIETTTYSYIPALTPTIEEVPSTKKTKKITNAVISAINEIENRNKSDQCLYCHRVYEILWPTKNGNQPFPRSQAPIKDQSYFIPVNKHSKLRNFAYQHSKNHLVPNKLKKTIKILNKHQLRTRRDDIHDKPEAKEINEFNTNYRKFGVFKKKRNSPKISNNLIIQYQRQAKKIERTKAKKSVRLFDDTNNDILPELMHAVLGAKSVDDPTIDTYKNLGIIEKYARIDNLFDFISVRDDKAGFQNMRIRKMSNGQSANDIHMNVLKYLILEDSKALNQYDWLGTTVQIQSALTKIFKLINHVRKSESINPADLQILKYIGFLHNLSLRLKEHNKLDIKLRKRVNLLPMYKKNSKNKLLKEKGLINRVWLYLRTLLPDLIEEDELSQLYEFLIDVRDGLFDLHEAIRHIADVTKFDRQKWYGNLKQLNLSTDKKHLQELLLHISMSRLIDLVEHSCKQGLDNDVVQYLQTHEKEAKRIVEEMLFIGNIVDEIKINQK